MISTKSVDKKELGKVRYNFLKTIEKDLKNKIKINSLYAPPVPEEQKRSGFKKAILGKTKEERSAELYMMFNASVFNEHFKNIICFLAPVPTNLRIVFQEYNYLIYIPKPIDSKIIYLEKRGSFKGKKGFYTVSYNVDSKTVSESDLFGQTSPSSVGFSLSDYLQRIRFQISLEKDTNKLIKEKEMSNICLRLNQNKDLSKNVSKLVASSEARQGNVYLRNPIGVTTILYPVGDSTVVQIGDFKCQPKRALDILHQILVSLSNI